MRGLIHKLLPLLMILMVCCACAQAEEVDSPLLMLASADAPLPADYVPEGLRQISAEVPGVRLVTSRSMMLQESALNALYKLMQAAKKDGVTLYVRQAYRSYADEARRYELLTGMGEPAQKPGESSYQTGLSVTLVGEAWRTADLTEAFAASGEAKWLSAHAAEYGFVLRYPEGKESLTGWSYEPWHYRYVGSAAAAEMVAGGLCLEELVPDSAWLDVEEEPFVPDEDLKKELEAELEEELDEEDEELEEAPDEEFEEEPVEEPEEATVKREHSVPPTVDLSGIDPEDIGPDGDYEISLFRD